MRTTDVGATETTNGILYARSGIHHARPSHNVSATTKNGTILLTTPTVDGTANTSGLPAKKWKRKRGSGDNYRGNEKQQSWGQRPNIQYQNPAVTSNIRGCVGIKDGGYIRGHPLPLIPKYIPQAPRAASVP